MRTPFRALALATAFALATGCLALDAIGPGDARDTRVASRAPVLAKNADDVAYTLHYVVRADDARVDGRYSPIAANGTALASIGFPASGNAQLTVTVAETGKSAAVTLTPASCARLELHVAVAHGQPTFDRVACG